MRGLQKIGGYVTAEAIGARKHVDILAHVRGAVQLNLGPWERKNLP
jgi:hypothetical protein